jgi:hypothetical protein
VELVALLAVPLWLQLCCLAEANKGPQELKPESSAVGIGTAEAAPFPKPARPQPLVPPALGKWLWRCGIVLIVASLIIQLASLAFWVPLEIYQMETLGHPTFVIALRFKNIAAFALDKMDAWGLNNESMKQDSWDYVHITTWNFLPFLLRRVGAAPALAVKIAYAAWGAVIVALAYVCRTLSRVVEW